MEIPHETLFAVMRLKTSGKSAASVALEFGITEAYVNLLWAGTSVMPKPEPQKKRPPLPYWTKDQSRQARGGGHTLKGKKLKGRYK